MHAPGQRGGANLGPLVRSLTEPAIPTERRPPTSMRRAIVLTIVLGLTALSSRAFAFDEWKQLYRDAVERDIKNKRFEDAIKHLNQALALKPGSSLGEVEYATVYFDYLPYYQLGVAYLGMGRRVDAIVNFNAEERQGVIQKQPSAYQSLKGLLKEAKDRDDLEAARNLRREFDKFMGEATDLDGRDRTEEAMAKASEARARAANLDGAAQARVAALIESLRQKQAAKENEAQLQRRREQLQRDLAEARKLLGSTQPTEALVRFDAILKTDPQNAEGLEGKREAGERILATTTRANRLKDLEEGRRLLDAGRPTEALPFLTEAATDATLSGARGLLKDAQDLSARRRKEEDAERRITELRREVSRLIGVAKFAEASTRLNLLLGLRPGDAEAAQQLADIDERNARNTLDLLRGDRDLPSLTFVAPKQAVAETFEDNITISGVASDDRGLDRVSFRSGTGFSRADVLKAGDEVRTHGFDESVPLSMGLNRVVVSVKDRHGRAFETVFTIERKPTWVDRPSFYPLVGLTAVSLMGSTALLYTARRRRAVRNRFNPYIAGAPVLSNQMFFGRKKLMHRVLNMIHANSLMITGDRRIGKTSFMHHLKMALTEDEGTEFKFFPVSIDLQGVPENTFFHTLMSEVVDALGLPETALTDLRFRSESDDYDDRDFSRDLQRVITELKTRTGKKVKLALLLDEVDELNEYSERVNQRLRSVFMKTFSENLVAVMSGVGIRRSWKSEGSPWYNFFDEFELSGLTRDEAEELIRTPVQGIFRFEDAAVERILTSSDLKPYIIQKFCIHSVNRMIEEGRSSISVKDVAEVESLVLSDESVAPRMITPLVTDVRL